MISRKVSKSRIRKCSKKNIQKGGNYKFYFVSHDAKAWQKAEKYHIDAIEAIEEFKKKNNGKAYHYVGNDNHNFLLVPVIPPISVVSEDTTVKKQYYVYIRNNNTIGYLLKEELKSLPFPM